jgi:hypothetical protein
MGRSCACVTAGALALVAAGCERSFDGTVIDPTPTAAPCPAAALRCAGSVLQRCGEAGDFEDVRDCGGDGLACREAACVCGTEGEARCNGASIERCAAGAWGVSETCAGETPSCAGGACVQCATDARRCGAGGVPQACRPAHVWVDEAPCGADAVCEAGRCTPLGSIDFTTVFDARVDDLADWRLAGATRDVTWIEDGALWMDATLRWPHALMWRDDAALALRDARVAVRFRADGRPGFVHAWLRARVEASPTGGPPRLYGYAAHVFPWDGRVGILRVRGDDVEALYFGEHRESEEVQPGVDYRLEFEAIGAGPVMLRARLVREGEGGAVIADEGAAVDVADDPLPAGAFGLSASANGTSDGRYRFDRVVLAAGPAERVAAHDENEPRLAAVERTRDRQVVTLVWREDRSPPLAGDPVAGVTLEAATGGGGALAIASGEWVSPTRAALRLAADAPDGALVARYDAARGAVVDAAGNRAASAVDVGERAVDHVAPVVRDAAFVGPEILEAFVEDASVPLHVAWIDGVAGAPGRTGLYLAAPEGGVVPIVRMAPVRRRPERVRLFVDLPLDARATGWTLHVSEEAALRDGAGNAPFVGSAVVRARRDEDVDPFDDGTFPAGWTGATPAFEARDGALHGAELAAGTGSVRSRLVVRETPRAATLDGTVRVDVVYLASASGGAPEAAVCARVTRTAGLPSGVCAGTVMMPWGALEFAVWVLDRGEIEPCVGGIPLDDAGYRPGAGVHTIALHLDGDYARGVLYLPPGVVPPDPGSTVGGEGERLLMFIDAMLDPACERQVRVDEPGSVAFARGEGPLVVDAFVASDDPCRGEPDAVELGHYPLCRP